MASQLPVRLGPRLGRKQVFLPNFTLTLLRTPAHPPNFASFIVPLNLNKLDLRDYLWNAYGISVRGVRSFIQQQKVRQDKPGEKRPKARKWFRPRAIKRMMVEMEQPFVWPAVPDKLDNWDKATFDAAQEQKEKDRESYAWDAPTKPTPERVNMARQARALLKGEKGWTPAMKEDEWEHVGEEVEVEQDVEIPPPT